MFGPSAVLSAVGEMGLGGNQAEPEMNKSEATSGLSTGNWQVGQDWKTMAILAVGVVLVLKVVT